MENVETGFNVVTFIDQYTGLSYESERKKVVCSYNGHEMPCTEAAIKSFVSGKKYKTLKDKHESQLMETYKQHLVPSKKKSTKQQLFCMLTLRHLNNQPHHIERHVNGKRFQKALARWEECKRTGVEFKPRDGQTRKRKESDSDSVKSSNSMFGKMNLASDTEEGKAVFNDDMDDMEDLYPPVDFASDHSDQSEASDFEIENPPAVSADVTSNNTEEQKTKTKSGEKRKAKENVPTDIPDKKQKTVGNDEMKKKKKTQKKSKKNKPKVKT